MYYTQYTLYIFSTLKLLAGHLPCINPHSSNCQRLLADLWKPVHGCVKHGKQTWLKLCYVLHCKNSNIISAIFAKWNYSVAEVCIIHVN